MTFQVPGTTSRRVPPMLSCRVCLIVALRYPLPLLTATPYSTSGRQTYRLIRTARSATTAAASSTIRFTHGSAIAAGLRFEPLPKLVARQRLLRFLVDECPSRRDLLPGVAPLAARAQIGHRINPDRRALSHHRLRSQSYERRHRHHRPRDICSVTIPASMTDRTPFFREYPSDRRPIRAAQTAEAEAFSMMETGRVATAAATLLIWRGFLPLSPGKATAKVCQETFRKYPQKSAILSVPLRDAAPLTCPGFGSPPRYSGTWLGAA